jgi:hypothetical protein
MKRAAAMTLDSRVALPCFVGDHARCAGRSDGGVPDSRAGWGACSCPCHLDTPLTAVEA